MGGNVRGVEFERYVEHFRRIAQLHEDMDQAGTDRLRDVASIHESARMRDVGQSILARPRALQSLPQFRRRGRILKRRSLQQVSQQANLEGLLDFHTRSKPREREIRDREVGPDLHGRSAHLLRQDIAIDVLIAVFEEDRFTPVAPRRDVVWATRNDDPGQRSHRAGLARPETQREHCSCPRILRTVFSQLGDAALQ